MWTDLERGRGVPKIPKFVRTSFMDDPLSNYATEADIRHISDVDTSSFALKSNLASWKTDVDKLNIDKLKTVPTNLCNLKSKVDKLDIDKLAPVPVNLSNLSNVVKNEVVKKTE